MNLKSVRKQRWTPHAKPLFENQGVCRTRQRGSAPSDE